MRKKRSVIYLVVVVLFCFQWTLFWLPKYNQCDTIDLFRYFEFFFFLKHSKTHAYYCDYNRLDQCFYENFFQTKIKKKLTKISFVHHHSQLVVPVYRADVHVHYHYDLHEIRLENERKKNVIRKKR